MARFVVLYDSANAGLLRPKAKVMNVLASAQKDVSMTPPKLKKVLEFKNPEEFGLLDILMTAGPSGDVFMKQASLHYEGKKTLLCFENMALFLALWCCPGLD